MDWTEMPWTKRRWTKTRRTTFQTRTHTHTPVHIHTLTHILTYTHIWREKCIWVCSCQTTNSIEFMFLDNKKIKTTCRIADIYFFQNLVISNRNQNIFIISWKIFEQKRKSVRFQIKWKMIRLYKRDTCKM